ncbi:S8 family serine peptidase [Pseudomonas sp. CGJS7]|uniref:S8 family serine peptidase n=1 Tax=Pseudomonas sp. CGJS7 TaxID=3109348 RepID=UPI00300BE202
MSLLAQSHRFRLHTLAAATVLALTAAGPAAAAGRVYLDNLKADGHYRQFIVKYRDGSAARTDRGALASSLDAAAGRAALKQRPGLKMLRAMVMPGGRVIGADADLDRDQAEALMRQIAADADVEFVQADGMVRALSIPNDPRYKDLWSYRDTAAGIRAPAAWDIATGRGQVVAVIDSGIYQAHADLAANLLPGYDFVSSVSGYSREICAVDGVPAGCGASQDGDGRDANPEDSSNIDHGAHVAGTIAAVGNNGVGVTGVAYQAKIVPIRALAKNGFGVDSDIVDALIWAVGGSVSGVAPNPNPAKIVNLSIGGSGACSQAPAWQAAIDAALARDAVVVVAAGNDNADAANMTPASCNGVITVAASTTGAARTSYSNFGATIDITAPGGNNAFFGGASTEILSTVRNNGYGTMAGTSMASPHVAGVVALMRSAASVPLSPARVQQILAQTARPIPASKCSGGCGPGLVDAAAAVKAARDAR